MPTRWVHFRIPEDVHDRIKAAAAEDRRSLSNWVAMACERALDTDAQEVLEFLRKTACMAPVMELAARQPGMPKTPFPELWARLVESGGHESEPDQ